MKEIDLFNKRILYIGPVSFHYDQALIKKLIALGAVVEAFPHYSSSLYFRILRKLKLPALETYNYDYYNKALLKNDFDYVLVRYGHQLKPEFLNRLRKANPNALFVNFHWDSIKPIYNYTPIIKYFDKVFSFDYKDCKTYNLNYLPLFYLDEYADFKKNNISAKTDIDLLFIGTWKNKERYDLIKLASKICKLNQLNFYYYLYFSFKQQFYTLEKGILPREAKNKFLSHNEILNLLSLANTVIDFPSSYQTGLTMRTFETLGAGKKLITSNQNIINEPFYDPEYISVVDINNFILDVDFIKKNPSTSLEKIKNYSLANYIYKLLQK